MLSLVRGSLGQRAGTLARYAALATVLVLQTIPARAAELLPHDREQERLREEVEAQARTDAAELASEVRRQMDADEDFAAWTRALLEQALARGEGAAARTATGPVPAGPQSGTGMAALTKPQGAAQVLVFFSFAVPEPSWRQWAAEAARAGAPLVLRGPSPAGLQATVSEAGRRIGGHAAGVAIDPRLFGLFGIERAPAVVVVPGGVPACASRGCADDPTPPFDRVTGNIGLAAALEAIAAEGEVGRGVAREFLQKMGGPP